MTVGNISKKTMAVEVISTESVVLKPFLFSLMLKYVTKSSKYYTGQI